MPEQSFQYLVDSMLQSKSSSEGKKGFILVLARRTQYK